MISRHHWELLLHHAPSASLRIIVFRLASRRFVFGFSVNWLYVMYWCSCEQKRQGVVNVGHCVKIISSPTVVPSQRLYLDRYVIGFSAYLLMETYNVFAAVGLPEVSASLF